jgi:hypothetical protein
MIGKTAKHRVWRLALLAACCFLPRTWAFAAETPTPPVCTIDPATVVRSGPGYRYPQAGWIVVHIEGAPYERGYQHGHLLAAELADFVQSMATFRSPKAPAEAWRDMRTLAHTLFLRRYDHEYLLEMKGIADGAAAAGAKFKDRALDLVDIVTINSIIEIEFLESGMDANPTGLEGLKLKEPPYAQPKASAHPHCSAFVATGPATADGKIVFGHITMFHLYCVRHYNVWLDIQPDTGHRVVMQTYPGGIMSGMDYYMNDAGLLVAETTIKQTGFDINGWSLASRIRKTVQYGASIDEAVAILNKDNNGLYSNEWLLADINTNEIAMFELGTHKSKLWRSSRDEWLADTKGFYWGCNNTKDLEVRLETVASTVGKPANVVFHPQDRDMAWLKLFDQRKGSINEAFGFEAFTTPPLAAFSSCDAKFTTTEMAKDLKTWALFGPPLGRTWDATPELLTKYPDIKPLVNNDWTLLDVNQELPKSAAPEKSPGIPLAVDLRSPKDQPKHEDKSHEIQGKLPPAWHGTILPESDADIWLAAAFADYEKIVALELAATAQAKNGKLDRATEDRLALAAFAPLSRWQAAVQRKGYDVALNKIEFNWKNDAWYQIAAGKGVALLSRIRDEMKTQQFLDCMDEFGRAHAGKKVSTAQFREHVEKSLGQSLGPWFTEWITQRVTVAPKGANFWSIDSFETSPQLAVIVYGTLKDRHAQREAAELLQRQIARRWSNHTVPIKSDEELTKEELEAKYLLLIGRPDCNMVTHKVCEQMPVKFGDGSFSIPARNEIYGNPASAVIVAGNSRRCRGSVVIFAGLSAEATRRCVEQLPARGTPTGDVMLLQAGKPVRYMALSTLVPVVRKEE